MKEHNPDKKVPKTSIPRRYKKSNPKTKRKGRKKKSYGFPNLLMNRNVVVRPNLVWCLDGTELPVTLNKQPKTKHYMFVGVDLCTNKVVFTKVFYSGTRERTFTSKAAIKVLNTAVKNEEIVDSLLIHSDVGPQFTSKVFFDYIRNHPLLEGSQTAGGQPYQNAVIERMHHTFKNQLKYLKEDLPTDVKTTRDLEVFCERRRKAMNSKAMYKLNRGLTPDEAELQQKSSSVLEPEVLMARRCSPFPELGAVAKINEYKDEVRFSTISSRLEASDLLDKMQITNVTTQHMVEEQGLNIVSIGEKVDKVLSIVTPKKRVTNKAQILRDPVPKSMLERILKASKPKGSHQLSWSRFQLTATLLYFSGLRISELAKVSEAMIQDILDNSSMTFYQPKVNKYRTIRFTSHGVEALRLVFGKTREVVFRDTQVIFPQPESGRDNVEKFTKSVNKLLLLFNDNPTKKISSHSFRVGFVSNSLKHTSAHNAQKLIGHADIRSTMKYSRYELDPEEESAILNQMFE